jgi:hypothetical protein
MMSMHCVVICQHLVCEALPAPEAENVKERA